MIDSVLTVASVDDSGKHRVNGATSCAIRAGVDAEFDASFVVSLRVTVWGSHTAVPSLRRRTCTSVRK